MKLVGDTIFSATTNVDINQTVVLVESKADERNYLILMSAYMTDDSTVGSADSVNLSAAYQQPISGLSLTIVGPEADTGGYGSTVTAFARVAAGAPLSGQIVGIFNSRTRTYRAEFVIYEVA